MSTTLTASSKKSPCGVCGDTTGKCRSTTHYMDQEYERGLTVGWVPASLCMTIDAAKNEVFEDWVSTGRSSDDLWTRFLYLKPELQKLRESWNTNDRYYPSDEEVAKREARRKEKQEAKATAQAEREARALSADERHQWYSQIFAELPVNRDLITDWDARGFTTEERRQCGFKSVVQWQKLSAPVDPRLPGVNQDGTSLSVSGDGYLCPIPDPEGRIIGCQIRLTDPGDGGRYRYLSTINQTLSLPSGENPLGYFRPTNKPKIVALVEGVGAKAFLVSQRYDAIVIGAPAGLWLTSPTMFRAYLSQAYAELGESDKPLIIFPDAGDTANKSVTNRWKKLASFLTEEKWSFLFGWWGQIDKSCDDADELTEQGRAEVNYISGSEFFSIAEIGVKNAQAKQEQEQKQQEQREQFDILSAARHKLVAITEKPYKIVNVPHMGEILQGLIEPGTINVIISDTGTGKSESIIPIAETADAFYSWHNRISLGRMMSAVLKIAYKDDAKRNKTKAAFCAPSAYQFDPKALAKGGVLLLDECDQVFDFLFGSLCNKDGIRPLLLSTLEAHFESAIAGNGIALCMSADITQKEIDYIKALAPEGTPVRLIINRYQPERPAIQHDSSSSPDGLIGKLLEKLDDEIPCFALDDMKNGVRGCKSVAEYVRTAKPELKDLVLEIHADNSNDPRVKAFFDNPDEESKKYLLIICSPSVISGVSLKNQRFIDGVFGFCNGVLIDREIKQFLNRVRGAKDISLWIAEDGFTVNGIDKDFTKPEEVKAYYQRNYEINSKHVMSYKAEYEPITAEWSSFHFELFCKNLLYRNLTMQHLRRFTIEHLQEIGYKIIDVNHIPEGGTKEIEDSLKAIWTGIEIAEAEAIGAARFLSEAEMEALEFSQEAIPPDVLPAYRKTKLRQQFGEELIEATTYHHKKSGKDFTGYAAMALKNNRGDYGRQLDAFYLLSRDISESAARDYASENRQQKRGFGRFAADVRWNSSKRKCRDFLGLLDFLDPEKWWQPSDYANVIEKARRFSTRIKDVLGFTVENISGGQIFGELMRQIGLTFQTQSVKGEKWKLRKIKSEDWQYAQMYIQHKEAIKSQEKSVEPEVAVSIAPTATEEEIAGFAELISECDDRDLYEAVIDGVNPEKVERALQEVSQSVRDHIHALYHPPEPVQLCLDDVAVAVLQGDEQLTQDDLMQSDELAQYLPTVDDGETVALMTSCLKPLVVVAALRSVAEDVRSKILGICDDLRVLFQESSGFSPATG